MTRIPNHALPADHTVAASGNPILLAMQGDQSAYGALVDSYQGMVFAVALNMTRNFSDSEDIVQETFLRAYQKLATLSDPAKFPAWIYQIARRIAADFLRARRRSATLLSEQGLEEIEAVESHAASPAESCMRREMSGILWAQVAELPPKAREAILLFYMENFSIQKAAAFLGISESAMKMRLQSGREKLRHAVMNQIEGELRRRQPPEQIRNAILASLPAIGLPPSQTAVATAPWLAFLLLAAKTKAIVAVAIAVLAIVGGTALLINNAIKPPQQPPSSPAPLTSTLNRPEGTTQTASTTANEAGEQMAGSPNASGASQSAAPTTTSTSLASASTAGASNATTPTQGTASIAGRVLNEKNEPVAGAGIFHLMSRPEGMSSDDFTTQSLAQSSADGQFTIPSLPAGPKLLCAYAKGYTLPITQDNQVSVTLKAGEKREGIELRLKKAYEISGKVVDHLHQPLEEASISGVPEDLSSIPYLTKSDKNGIFSLEGIPIGKFYLTATKTSYLSERKSANAGATNTDFVLAPESGISGHITIKETGAPVVGVKVTAPGGGRSSSTGNASSQVNIRPGEATTDEKGFYIIKGLSSDQYLISVAPYKSGSRSLVTETRDMNLPLGQIVQNVDFAMGAGASVSGKITEKGTGKPIANAVVTSKRIEGNRAVSGADGSYRLDGLRPDRHYLLVTADGYVIKYILGLNKQGAGCEINLHKQVDLGEEEELTGVDFEMSAETVIKGRAVDQDSKPLPGTKIDLLQDSGLLFNFTWNIMADSNGCFEIRKIIAGNYYLKGSLANYATARTELLKTDEGKTLEAPDLVLRNKAAIISGTITASDNTPIKDADVKIVQIYHSDRGPRAWADFHVVGQATSSADGSYRTEKIGTGPVQIQIAAPGLIPQTRDITVDNPAREYKENFTLVPAVSIAGNVKGIEGSPLVGVNVLAKLQIDNPGQMDYDAAATGPDGSFRLARIARGQKYELEFQLNSFQKLQIKDAVASDKPIEIVMHRCGGIQGKVVDAQTTKPVQDFGVVTYNELDTRKMQDAEMANLTRTIHSPDGAFQWPDLQAGKYHIVILCPDYARFEKTDVVVEQEKSNDVGILKLSLEKK